MCARTAVTTRPVPWRVEPPENRCSGAGSMPTRRPPSPARNIASSSSLARSPTLAGVGSTKADPVRTTAKVDYAMRAAIELARAYPDGGGRPGPITRQAIADAQDIPAKFLEHILSDLKRSRLVASVRGAEGGYWLSRDPTEITMADVIRAVEGPLADVRGVRPDSLDYPDDLAVLQRAWIAVRANLRSVLERVTIADLRDGRLAPEVDILADTEDAWAHR